MNSHVLRCIAVFFLTAGLLIAAEDPGKTASSHTLTIHADRGTHTISRHIYGHFAEHLGGCIYGGVWVGPESSIPNTRGIRNDVTAALRKIKVPNIRWPGGCFADDYHWKDGIGPREQRPPLINTSWGVVVENNHFGTHEFMDFCEQVGAEPFICGNIGSGTVKEMAEWVQYLTSDHGNAMAELRKKNGREKPWKVKYWAIGNETWGCGGIMSADHYANEFARYSFFLKNYGDNSLYKIASGGLPQDYVWTETIMEKWSRTDGWLQGFLGGFSLHFYAVTDWGKKGSATKFTENEWFTGISKALEMDQLVVRHSAVMDKYDPQKKIGLIVDEWGNWYDVEPGTNSAFLYQQNSLRDAVTTAINLNIFNNRAERVKVANIAQLVNVLQAPILTDTEKMILTPTYHVFEMYTVHHDATLLPAEIKGEEYSFGGRKLPGVTVSASRDQAGAIHVSLCNLDPNRPATVSAQFRGASPKTVSGRVLTASEMTAHNTFANPNAVTPQRFTDARIAKDGFSVTLPPKSVVVLQLK
ncbi:MAG: alpha-N-arabinofuranosidase [Ignavibacteria bacterium]|nr:alpha-N-arabinofuranosidase [Ignavibacteria bacterium]